MLPLAKPMTPAKALARVKGMFFRHLRQDHIAFTPISVLYIETAILLVCLALSEGQS